MSAIIKMGRKGKKQKGKGRSLSMPLLSGNFMHRRKRANRIGIKKKSASSRGRKGQKRGRHTQIPIKEGFISKTLRNRPKKRSKPTDGIVNDLPSVQQMSSKLQPQQVSWGN